MKIFKFSQVLPQVPNLLLRGRLKFKFELLPYEVKGLSWKKRWNFFCAGLNQFFLPSRPVGHPVIAQVEPANVCNLSCPMCLSVSGNNSRPPAVLSFDTFKKFIDQQGDYLLLIVLWNWGEPFLNPDITRIIRYATDRGIIVHSSTNGNVPFNDETADEIIRSGLSSLVFAIDGATQETYQKYRQGGDLNQVKENFSAVIRAKKRHASPTPVLNLRFVAMRHNEAELPQVKEMAHELGANFFTIKSVDMPPELGENLDYTYCPANEQLRRYEYESNSFKRKDKPFECMRPWKRITIDASGEVISCEYDYKNLHSFGNITGTNSVINIWKSQSSRLFRRRFNKGHNDFYHCQNCTYKNLKMEECNMAVYPIQS